MPAPSSMPARPTVRGRIGPAGGARAGRVHRRAQGVPADLAVGRPPGADPEAGDRTARRDRAVARSGRRVADVGTGSGAVALALKEERPDLSVVGVDLSPDALAVARSNAAALGLDVEFVQADLLEGVPGPFDAVLSNLPYVAEGSALPPEIELYEPDLALFGGPTEWIRSAACCRCSRECDCSRSRSGWPRRSPRSCGRRLSFGRDPATISRDTNASSSAVGERPRGVRALHRGRGRRPVRSRHRVRARVRSRGPVRGRAPVPAQAAQPGQAFGSHVLFLGAGVRGRAGDRRADT